MPDYKEYRRSISNELISIKDRVRHFIDDNHWGEDGRYKEIILMELLKNMLPQNICVGTGFVVGDDNRISSQIDIVIYKSSYPVLFRIGDFVVVAKESVVGIIEIKSKLESANIQEAIEKSNENGQIIGNHIFNGIFGYETGFKFMSENLAPSVRNSLINNVGYINNICFGKDYFVKYWENGNPVDRDTDNRRSFSFYKINDLAFGYFISNLIEQAYQFTNNNQDISGVLGDVLYPIEGTKETQRLTNFEIKID
jgi:hypothetical protein